MKRKALLIGMPGTKKPGSIYNAVMHDLKYFKEYLMSNAGGEWDENEIMTELINPSSFGVIGNIASINADYSLVYFSGHGGEYRSRNQVIDLSDGEFSIVNLRTTCSKQLIVIDSCRSIIDEETKGIVKKGMLEEYEEKYTFVKNSKLIFNRHLENCENGIILLNAATFEHPAGCNQTESFFTSSLVMAGYEWHNNLGGEEQDQILDVFDAVIKSQGIMMDNFPTDQEAECIGGKRRRFFPFAVRNYIL